MCQATGGRLITRLEADLRRIWGQYLTGSFAADLIQCNRCGITYVAPQPDEAELARYYGRWFEGISPETRAITARAMAPVIRRVAALVESHTAGKRLLEIGCGDGAFLEHMRDKGFAVTGVEMSEACVGYLQGAGFAVHRGPLAALRFADGSFDAAVMLDLLEHLRNPVSALTEVYRLLAPGGMLLARVPNFAFGSLLIRLRKFGVRLTDLSLQLEVPNHLCYYSPRTAAALFHRTGLERVEVSCSPGLVPGHLRWAWPLRLAKGTLFAGFRFLRKASAGKLNLCPSIIVMGLKPCSSKSRKVEL